MRTAIAEALNNDAGLRSLGLPQGNVLSANNAESDMITSRPFIIVKWSDRQSYFAARNIPSQPNLLDIWFYDERGDYSRIDEMIARTKVIFAAIVAAATTTGFITQIDWVGDGGDNYDDVWKAICRTSTFRVIGSYLPS